MNATIRPAITRPACALTVIALSAALPACATADPVTPVDPASDTRLNHNMVDDARNLPAALDANTQKWQVELPCKFLYGQPVFTGDKVLVGMDGRIFKDDPRMKHIRKIKSALVCFERDTGKMLWKLSFGAKGQWWAGHGLTSTPWVEGERVYLVSPMGQAMCLDLNGLANGNDGPFTDEAKLMDVESLEETDGDVIWAYDFERKHGIRAHDSYSSDPLIVGKMMIFATGHARGVKPTPAWVKEKDEAKWSHVPTPNLLVLDKNTGKLLAADDVTIPRVFHGQWSSPTLARRADGENLIVWGSGYGMLHGFALPEVASIGRDGEPLTLTELWRYDCNPKDVRYDANGHEAPFPRHHNTPETRAVGASHIIGKPVYHGGRVYVAIGRDHYYSPRTRENMRGALHCIDPSGSGDITETGRVWMKRMPLSQSTVSVRDGMVFLADQSGLMHCLDAETGATHWTHDMGHDVTCRSQLLADDKVYVSTDTREMFVFAASDEKNLLWQGKADDRPATVGVDDGLVILATPRSVTAYTTD